MGAVPARGSKTETAWIPPNDTVTVAGAAATSALVAAFHRAGSAQTTMSVVPSDLATSRLLPVAGRPERL